MDTTPSRRHVELIDVGRLVAALSVLSFHYFYNGIRNGKIHSGEYLPHVSYFAAYGYLGVDLFFMISGYVIFFSAQGRSSHDFIASRLTRIFPTFWGAVFITSCYAYMFGSLGTEVTVRQMLANLLLFPQLFHEKFVDGVYWTLVYEIDFYALIGLLLLSPFAGKLKQIALFWPFAIAIAQLSSHKHLPYLTPTHAFFVAGCLFAIIKTDRTPLSLSALATAFVICIISTIGHTADVGSPFQRSSAAIGGIIVMMFAFFSLANSIWMANFAIPGSRMAGNITYPLYLIHAHIGYMTLSVLGNSPTGYILTITVVFLLAITLHQLVERQLRDYWYRAFSRTVAFFLPSTKRWASTQDPNTEVEIKNSPTLWSNRSTF